MPKSLNILSFRPNEWEERAVKAAEEATGFQRSELLRRCVSKSLGAVVREILSRHTAAVERFEEVIKESSTPAATGAATPVTYPKSFRKQRKPAA